MSLKIHPRPKETHKQARERVRVNLLSALDLLEKGMGPLDADSPDCIKLKNAYDIIEAIFDEEFD